MKSRILIIDDDDSIRGLLETRLNQLGYEVHTGQCIADLWDRLKSQEFHLLLLDYQLPDGDGIGSIPEIKRLEPDLPVIIITAHGTVDKAVDAMRQGAYNFSPKPVDFDRLEGSIKNALEHYRLQSRVARLERSRRQSFCGMIGGSAGMQVVYNTIETVAPSKAPVLVIGESGTGKELVARAIHQCSPRTGREIVEVNCAAIPKDLLESELFGHEKAAFTGASDRYVGRCEQAHGSTLFLDEIGEMDIGLQAKMLRFLQEQSLYRIGGKQKIEVDARIVSATNRDPMKAIEEERLREDLYYRLNVVRIEVPPLRSRREDVPDLAAFFLEKYSKENGKSFADIAPPAADALCDCQWKGNVRELENVIYQCVVMHSGTTLTADMLPSHLKNGEPAAPAGQPIESPSLQPVVFNGIIPLDALERDAIENAIRLLEGNVTKASAALNISQATLYRKIKEYGLNLKGFK